MNEKLNDIKSFWDNQALTCGSNPNATTQDIFMREIEINYISTFLSSFREPLKVLDIGCGNGYSTIEYKKRAEWHEFVGGDYSEEMIRIAKEELANKKIAGGISFRVMNVLELTDYKEKYDIIISDRCLINLGGAQNRKKALWEIANCLTKNGQYLMIENFLEGNIELNRLREYIGLPEIPLRWHNSFFTMNELDDSIKHIFRVERMENISSLYYLITRVVYSKLCNLEGREPDYTHPIYQVAAQLPPIGNFGPIYAITLKRS